MNLEMKDRKRCQVPDEAVLGRKNVSHRYIVVGNQILKDLGHLVWQKKMHSPSASRAFRFLCKVTTVYFLLGS